MPGDQVVSGMALAAARGDDAALEQLVRAYHDRVHRFGLRACRDAFDADDAVQEAFVKLSRRPDVMRDPGMLSWLFSVVKRTCLRLLRPRTSHADALPAPSARAKGTTVEEPSLTAALDRLEAAVRAAHSSRTIRDLTVTDEPPDPTACIAGTAVCAGDNRDTVYPRTPPFVLGRTDDVYVLGVDHTVTHHATYANASVYSVEHLAGLVSVTSRTWSGSASEWLPGDPDASSLFVWRISRDCGTDAHCLAVPTTECPTGASYATLLDIAFRAYLEPGTGTGPSPSTLILERALLVQGP